ncbi:hypothetical protein DFH27DRAFT_551396 [Peziza echinospora]|nr:hypothetical protein DFH27DRAFT_551396 [Peziza echinospora]
MDLLILAFSISPSRTKGLPKDVELVLSIATAGGATIRVPSSRTVFSSIIMSSLRTGGAGVVPFLHLTSLNLKNLTLLRSTPSLLLRSQRGQSPPATIFKGEVSLNVSFGQVRRVPVGVHEAASWRYGCSQSAGKIGWTKHIFESFCPSSIHRLQTFNHVVGLMGLKCGC